MPYHRVDQLAGVEIEEAQLGAFGGSYKHVVLRADLDRVDLGQ